MYIQGSKMRVTQLKKAPRVRNTRMRSGEGYKTPRTVVSKVLAYHSETIHLPAVVRVQPIEVRSIGVQTSDLCLPDIKQPREEGKDNGEPTAHEIAFRDRMMNDPMFDGGFY